MTVRALDHLVLPTASLAVARERLSRLGFSVAPEGVHPFGTANACVYFPGGTFLELLALRDGPLAARAIADGNVFVARDHVFRAMRGEEGFSAIVLASNDADRDHATFVAADVSGGDMLTFSRESADSEGNVGLATFKLAFAADVETADAFLFTCQRVNVPAIDRSGLERHVNGVTGIREIVLGDDARSFFRLIEEVTGDAVGADAEAVYLANASLRLTAPSDPAGIAETGATLAAIVFDVADLETVGHLLDAGGIHYMVRQGGLVVPPERGQGAVFIFRSTD